jgi:hypothetical protein
MFQIPFVLFALFGHCHAADLIELKTKYWVLPDGQRALTSEWFTGVNLALFNMRLRGFGFEQVREIEALDLGSAVRKEVIAPELPEGCTLNEVSASFAAQSESTQVFSFALKGRPCQAVVDDLVETPVMIEFTDVPTRRAGRVVKTVRVLVQR